MGRDYKPPIGKSCAICADFVPMGTPGTYEPIGPMGAEVFVCTKCSEEPIVAKRGPDLPYEPEGFVTPEALTSAMKEKMGEERYRTVTRLDRDSGRAALATSKEDILANDYAADTRERNRRSSGKLPGGKAGTRMTKPSSK